ncbi:MAG: transporter substrate-binding domain-containing protein [Lysinibacillus sp.]|nr:transporter substrate-binding domain-containing protein [Lysinibacillus sp.]
MKKKLLLLFTTMMTVLVLAACGSGNDSSSQSEGSSGEGTEQSDSKAVLKVGMEAAYAPFNWTQNDDSNGAVPISGTKEYAAGYDVEIAKRIAEGLGMELEIVKTKWEGLIPSLQSGAIDVVIAGMSPTPERMQEIDFTDNYYTRDFVIVVKEDGPYANAKSIHDFEGAKVTGQQGTTHYKVIDQMKGAIKEVAATDFGQMRIQLTSGAIDAYISERPEGMSAEAAIEGVTYIVPEDGFEADESDTAIAAGLKKGSDLKEKINAILAEISEEERQQIMEEAIKNQPSQQ